MKANFVVSAIRTAALAGLPADRTDAQLLTAFLDDRDSLAFAALVRRHGPLVQSACRGVLRDQAAVDDAFQATFVQLHRQAKSIRRQTSIAGWLFRVARRTALRAKRTAARRATHEARAIVPLPAEPDLSWTEACGIIHEELDRLPDRYRDPLILCYLDGLSRDEAATRLGWTLNELRGRLERGRDRLRKRLERRGVTLTAGLGAVLGFEAVRPALVRAALQSAPQPDGAVAALAGQSLRGVLSAIGGTVAILFVAALAAAPASPGIADGTLPSAKGKADAPKAMLEGRVLLPDGKPAAGAVVWQLEFRAKATEVARTGDDGTFRIATDRPQELRNGGPSRIVATKPGFGLAIPPMASDGEFILRLVTDDVPIRGRVVDLEGKPVAGAKIEPMQVFAGPTESLGPFLDMLKARPNQHYLAFNNVVTRRAAPVPGLGPLTTDSNGAFEIRGIGRERLLRMRVRGAGIAVTECDAMTRDSEPIRVLRNLPNSSVAYTAQGARCNVAAKPEQVVRGVVTAGDTGKPIAGARVQSPFPYGLETTTDAVGRFTLNGVGPGQHEIFLLPPPQEPHLPRATLVGRANSSAPVTLDVTLHRGVWVEGVVIDASSKRPIGGAQVSYTPLDPEQLKDKAGDSRPFGPLAQTTDAAGRFRIATLPGPTAIAVLGLDGNYVDGMRRSLQGDHGRMTLAEARARWPELYFSSFHAVAIVDVDPKMPKGRTITLDRGLTVKGRAVDPGGRPIAGYRASGLDAHVYWTNRLPSAEFEARQVTGVWGRAVLLWHEDRKLSAVYRPSKINDGEDVTLKPTGTLRGRIVGAEGQAAAGLIVTLDFRLPSEDAWSSWFPRPDVKTDAQGRFEFTNLPDGVTFSVRADWKGMSGMAIYQVVPRVKTGAVTDLGDLKPR